MRGGFSCHHTSSDCCEWFDEKCMRWPFFDASFNPYPSKVIRRIVEERRVAVSRRRQRWSTINSFVGGEAEGLASVLSSKNPVHDACT